MNDDLKKILEIIEPKIKEIFNLYDEDLGGTISIKEMSHLLKITEGIF
jgi:Ca2+-binding EF-hand superfamily protein